MILGLSYGCWSEGIVGYYIQLNDAEAEIQRLNQMLVEARYSQV